MGNFPRCWDCSALFANRHMCYYHTKKVLWMIFCNTIVKNKNILSHFRKSSQEKNRNTNTKVVGTLLTPPLLPLILDFFWELFRTIKFNQKWSPYLEI